MEELIFVAIAAAAAGLLIGFFTGRRMSPGSQQSRDLEQQLEDVKAAQENYENRVHAHFADTATRLNSLTENYREVYESIARGAADLSPQNAAAAFTALQSPEEGPETIEADSVMVEPPRDYAPKTSPDDPGMLNERFGLEGEDLPPEDSTTRHS